MIKVSYDSSGDALSIVLSSKPVDKSVNISEYILADVDIDRRLVGFRILDANNVVPECVRDILEIVPSPSTNPYILVNGRRYDLTTNWVSYDDIMCFAKDTVFVGPVASFSLETLGDVERLEIPVDITVSYTDALEAPYSGTMGRGDWVKVQEGTHFIATYTGNT